MRLHKVCKMGTPNVDARIKARESHFFRSQIGRYLTVAQKIFLDHFVTIDETQFATSIVGLNFKARVSQSIRKIKGVWDFGGILFIDYLEGGSTVQYYTTLVSKFMITLKKREEESCSVELFVGTMVQQDKNLASLNTFDDTGFEAYSDFYLSLGLKERLQGTKCVCL